MQDVWEHKSRANTTGIQIIQAKLQFNDAERADWGAARFLRPAVSSHAGTK